MIKFAMAILEINYKREHFLKLYTWVHYTAWHLFFYFVCEPETTYITMQKCRGFGLEYYSFTCIFIFENLMNCLLCISLVLCITPAGRR